LNGKRKRFIIAFVLMSTLFVLLAYASVNSVKTVDNNFTPASVDVAVVENGAIPTTGTNTVAFESDKAENPTYTAAKKIQIKNVGSNNPAPVYVRVCIFPKFDCDTSTDLQVGILADIPNAVNDNTLQWGDVTFKLVEDWKNNWYYDGTSGYFYYIADKLYTTGKDEDGNEVTLTANADKAGVLPVGFTTAPLLESVSVNGKVIEENYQNRGALLRVSVLVDSIQTVGGAVEQRWKINSLSSNDEPRPEEKTESTASEQTITPMAVSEDDTATSESAVRSYVMTQYEKARVEKMVTSVTATVVYSLPEEDTSDTEEINEEENAEAVEIENKGENDDISEEATEE
jgi:hypothetical protein